MFQQLTNFLSANKLGRYLAITLIILFAVMALNNLWELFGRWGWVNQIDQGPRTITISAQGKVTATPDTARMSMSVVSDGKTAQEVQQKNTEAMNKVIAFVKSNGVKDEDVKTTSYNLYPKYDYIEGRQAAAGYSLNQALEVKIRDIKKAGEIITGAVGAGANQVFGVEFFVDDPEGLKSQARVQALEKARAKAKESAKAAKVRLGKIITFTESGNMPSPIFFEKSAGPYGIGGGAPAVDTQAGSQEITVDVSVIFEIK